MSKPSYITTPQGRRIAYHQTAGHSPGVVFLGGFKSDMDGNKAMHLESWAKAQGRAYLRLDYSGHGQSSGVFTDGCIGEWAADAREVIQAVCEGPQILVGSSMGGWISVILAGEIPEIISGIVAIAAAPDFTEDSIWANFSPEQRADLADTGQVALPSEYGDPYIITEKLITDGRKHLVLKTPLNFPFAVRLLQGTADADVDMSVALHLLDHAACDDIRLTLVKGADHRFSTAQCLALIESAVSEVLSLSIGKE